MTNEEFQRIVLNKFDSLETEISGMKMEISSMKADMSDMKAEMSDMKSNISNLTVQVSRLDEKMDKMDHTLTIVYDQTAVLTEFKHEMNEKLDKVLEDNQSISQIIGEHEIAIRTLRRKAV